MAASLEANSEHPIAAGIAESSREKGTDLIPIQGFNGFQEKGLKVRFGEGAG